MKKLIISTITVLLLASSMVNAQWVDQDSGYEIPWILFDNSFPAGQNNVGYVCGMRTTYNGPGVILKTEDAGNTWTTILGGEDESLFGLEAIFFTSVDTGFAVGWDDNIIYTTDGGNTWNEKSVGSDIYFYTDIEFWDANNGVISGSLNSGGSRVWVTADGGDTWTEATGIETGIIDLAYADANTLISTCNDDDLYKSTDGGLTWSLNYDGDDPDDDPLLGVNFGTDKFGVVGGMDGKVMITTDGGNSWSEQVVGNGSSLYAIKCFGSDSIYVGGSDRVIYKSLDSGETWTQINDGWDEGTLYQFAFTPNHVGYVTGAHGTIMTQIPIPEAHFTSDVTELCTEGSVHFYDASYGAITSWSWNFPGGNPSSSTNQNPLVTYPIAGVYDVELTVSDGTGSDTEIITGYITVMGPPAQADLPSGDTEVCTGEEYIYEIPAIEYADSYEWQLSTEQAGTLDNLDSNVVVLTTSTYWTGDFTISVRAINSCGEGEWSEDLSITMFLSPYDFEVEGGGAYCEGGEAPEVTLSGSETGMTYELYLNGEPTGNVVEGTGAAISFGPQEAEGTYTVYASNDNCTVAMIGEVEVTMQVPPTPVVEGEDMVCDYSSSEYTTEDHEGSTYTWDVTGGTITDGQGTATVTVEWAGEGNGTVMVSEETSGGCEGESDVFNVMIDNCTGISDPNTTNDIKIYPNPARNYINISLTVDDGTKYTMTIYNTLGQQVYTIDEAGNGQQQTLNIDVNHLPQGLYIIRLVSENNLLWQGRFERLK
jgi:PKD repeat protein